MEQILNQYKAIRSSAEKINYSLAHLLRPDCQYYPVGFFNMAINQVTLTFELLSYYNEVWRKTTSVEGITVEKAREQNSQRVVMIQKMSFIGLISSLEYAAKKIIELGDSKLVIPTDRRIYLGDIMKKSLHQEIISEKQYVLWSGAVKFRNTLVHNNGIPDKSDTYFFPEFELSLIKDEMSVGKLNLFGNLNHWLISSAEEWFRGIYS